MWLSSFAAFTLIVAQSPGARLSSPAGVGRHAARPVGIVALARDRRLSDLGIVPPSTATSQVDFWVWVGTADRLLRRGHRDRDHARRDARRSSRSGVLGARQGHLRDDERVPDDPGTGDDRHPGRAARRARERASRCCGSSGSAGWAGRRSWSALTLYALLRDRAQHVRGLRVVPRRDGRRGQRHGDERASGDAQGPAAARGPDPVLRRADRVAADDRQRDARRVRRGRHARALRSSSASRSRRTTSSCSDRSRS